MSDPIMLYVVPGPLLIFAELPETTMGTGATAVVCGVPVEPLLLLVPVGGLELFVDGLEEGEPFEDVDD